VIAADGTVSIPTGVPDSPVHEHGRPPSILTLTPSRKNLSLRVTASPARAETTSGGKAAPQSPSKGAAGAAGNVGPAEGLGVGVLLCEVVGVDVGIGDAAQPPRRMREDAASNKTRDVLTSRL
jgi:hypothetical protein